MGASTEHTSSASLRVLDRLDDTSAEIATELGETLLQTPVGVALTGDTTHYAGSTCGSGYRWFIAAACRQIYAPEEHAFLTRIYGSGLREIVTLPGPSSRAAHRADLLLDCGKEFRRVWDDPEIGIRAARRR